MGVAPPPASGGKIVEIADKDTAEVMLTLLAGAASVDRIAAAIGLTAAQVSTILGREELSGSVVRLPDGCYQRLLSGEANPPAVPGDA